MDFEHTLLDLLLYALELMLASPDACSLGMLSCFTHAGQLEACSFSAAAARLSSSDQEH